MRFVFRRDEHPEWTAGLAYLATVRSDGGPRVHPLSPVLVDGALLVFVLRASPKHGDLIRDGRYALHSFPHPLSTAFTDNEFYATGSAEMRDDPMLRGRVAELTHDDASAGDVFELFLQRVLVKLRRPGVPLYTRWRAS